MHRAAFARDHPGHALIYARSLAVPVCCYNSLLASDKFHSFTILHRKQAQAFVPRSHACGQYNLFCNHTYIYCLLGLIDLLIISGVRV